MKEAKRKKLEEKGWTVRTRREITLSQPRISKADNGDASVSIELLIRVMLATGAAPQEIE